MKSTFYAFYLNTEDEPMSFDENYNPNVLQKSIVLSPDLFEKKGIEPPIKIKSKGRIMS